MPLLGSLDMLVPWFLGDMLSAGGGVEEAVRCQVRCAWGKFNELMPILTMKSGSP